METVVDLESEAYKEAQRLAAERGQSVGKVLSDSVLKRTITSEEIRAIRDVDETWEITRGNLHHPFHKPILTTDEQGFPQVDIGRPLTLEEVRAAVEED